MNELQRAAVTGSFRSSPRADPQHQGKRAIHGSALQCKTKSACGDHPDQAGGICHHRKGREWLVTRSSWPGRGPVTNMDMVTGESSSMDLPVTRLAGEGGPCRLAGLGGTAIEPGP